MVLPVTFQSHQKIMAYNNSKKGFNAHVEEYIGDFIKPIKPMLYKLQTYLKHKRR